MPQLSIVIPVFNCLELTQACVKSLEATVSSRLDLEILIVDDASTDGTAAWLATLPTPRYRVIRHEANRGYAAANNAAAKVASGRILLLLNNDTVLLPNWLEPMLRVLERAPAAGIVGNIQREAVSGLIDHTGMLFTLYGIPLHVGKNTVSPPPGEFHRWPAVTGACCAMPRELFIQLGGFDETFRNGYEDIDLCLKARAEGQRTYVANRSVIYHHVSASPGRRTHDDENLVHFLDRWGGLLESMAAQHVREKLFQSPQYQQRVLQMHQHRHHDGWRYLRKHALRPWRYNATRLRIAIARAFSPLPQRAVETTEPFFFP